MGTGLSLFELTEAAADLQEQLESGEMDELAFSEAMDSIGLDEKLKACVHVLKNFEAEAEAFKAERERLAAREKTAKNAVERLKSYLVDNLLKIAGSTKAKAGTFSVSLGTSKAVAVFDESAIPAEFLIPQPPKVDKVAINKVLKAGEKVPGAVLIENHFIKIR